MADEKKNKVYRFDARSSIQATFPDAKDAKEREITRMVLDGEGGIVMLDRDEKTVHGSTTRTGKLLRARVAARTSCASPWTWPSIPSATSTSPTKRLGVLVFSPAGPAPGHALGSRSVRKAARP